MKKKILYTLLGLVGLVVLLVLVVTGIGMTLPEQHSFARSMALAQPPEAVWAVIADFRAQPTWRLDLASVEPETARSGRPRWKVTTTHRSSAIWEIEEATPPERLVWHTYFGDAPQPLITWHVEIAPAGGGSRITIRESGDFGNPYTRFMVRYVLGQTKFVDDYLTFLAKKFGVESAIQ